MLAPLVFLEAELDLAKWFFSSEDAELDFPVYFWALLVSAYFSLLVCSWVFQACFFLVLVNSALVSVSVLAGSAEDFLAFQRVQ